jgi:N-carbamoylputrescine amidase
VFYNSVAIIDADGTNLGIYRKSHIPDGPGYSEKFYFTPGDTGFKVWDTAYAKIGVGICWDQWFPECARAMALQGAELLFYPTAIGSEPHDETNNSSAHWQRTQQGHAAANLVPLIASNRIGRETQDDFAINFYGASFITDEFGAKVAEADGKTEAVLVHTFDLDKTAQHRHEWGVYRDRRIDLYDSMLTKDGHTKSP